MLIPRTDEQLQTSQGPFKDISAGPALIPLNAGMDVTFLDRDILAAEAI